MGIFHGILIPLTISVVVYCASIVHRSPQRMPVGTYDIPWVAYDTIVRILGYLIPGQEDAWDIIP